MGYESKLIVVERSEHKDINWIYGEVIAEFKLSCLPWDFDHRKVFTEPIDFDLWDGDEKTREDKYGEHCGMAHVSEVVKALEQLAENEDYRRYAPCIALLKGFDESQWKDLRVVHWGY